MAKINGLEVKEIKYYPDHEGSMIPYGNIYFKGKRVGSFKYDDWGGPMHYTHTHKTISKKEVMEAFHQIVPKLGWNEFYDSFDILVEELIFLKEIESEFKKSQKKDRFILVVKDDYYKKPSFDVVFQPRIYEIPNQVTDEGLDRAINELLEKYGSDKVVHVFRSLEDFNL